jgi:hypothetical protein
MPQKLTLSLIARPFAGLSQVLREKNDDKMISIIRKNTLKLVLALAENIS